MKKPLSSCLRLLPAVLCLVLQAAVPLTAQVPQIINYQGKIAVGAVPFTGAGTFRFALVNGAGTVTYWSNNGSSSAGSQPTVGLSLPVVNGLYVAPLGDANLQNTDTTAMAAIPASVFQNADVRVRVWFDDGSHGSQLLAPDQRILSVGYAMVAQTVPNASITTEKLAPALMPQLLSQSGAGVPADSTNVGKLYFDTGLKALVVSDGTAWKNQGVRHDRQQADFHVNPQPGVGSTFVDVTGATLTTKSLGESGAYIINARGTFGSSTTTTPVEFILNIGGTDVTSTSTWIVPSATANSNGFAVSHLASGLASGTVIKLRVRNVGSTSQHYFWNCKLIIDGVPASTVVP